MNVVGYIRMSTGYQENSPENQKSAIMDYCARHGHSLVKFYEDLAISGGKMDKRSSLLEMIVDAENNGFGILFYKYDRAFRNLGEQIAVLGRLKNKGIFYDGVADPSGEGASGELVTNILGAVNQFERQLTGERIYHNNREKARNGYWTGSNRAPFGYDYNKETKEMTVNQGEAEAVMQIFSLYLSLRSSSQVAKVMRLSSVTKTGGIWTDYALLRILANPVYVGKLRWGYRQKVAGKNWHKIVEDYEVFPGRHEAIIDEATFHKVQEILKENAVTQRKPKSQHILGGLIKCAKCQGTVSGTTDRNGDPRYRCQAKYYLGECEGWSRKGDALLAPVIDTVKAQMKNIDPHLRILPDITEKPAISIDNQMKAIEVKIKRLYFAFENDTINETMYIQRNAELQKEKERITRSANKNDAIYLSKAIIEIMGNFDTLWEYSDNKEKRQILNEVIDKIYSDGKTIQIHFCDFNLPNWQTVVNARVLL